MNSELIAFSATATRVVIVVGTAALILIATANDARADLLPVSSGVTLQAIAETEHSTLPVLGGSSLVARSAGRLTLATFVEMAERSPSELIARIRLGDMSPGLLARAAEALGRVSDGGIAVPLLIELLSNSDPVVQEGAIYGLQRHMNADVRERLQEIAESESTHEIVRDVAREALED